LSDIGPLVDCKIQQSQLPVEFLNSAAQKCSRGLAGR
jgi:hypothetical protein